MWVWVSSLEWMKLSHVVFGNSYVIFVAFVEVLLAHAHVLYALLSGQTFVLRACHTPCSCVHYWHSPGAFPCM